MERAVEILILSGKGGTGKTTLAASLSKIINDKVIVDADVDAADMHILLSPKTVKKENFKGSAIALIDREKCNNCGLCKTLCRFDAIDIVGGKHIINEYKCEGCTLCKLVCPVSAITMEEQIVGEWYISNTDYGKMVSARLIPGAENSGNLVTMVKHQSQLVAREDKERKIIIDGPPGVGCPVISSLSGIDYVIMVTEPTISGVHDLKRVVEVAMHFKPKIGIVINKFDLNRDHTEEIKKFASEKNIDILGLIPFDKCIVDALMEKKTPIDKENCRYISDIIYNIKDKLLKEVEYEPEK